MSKEIRRVGPYPSNRKGRVNFIKDLLVAGADGFEVPVESFNTEAKMHFGSRLQIFLHKVVEDTPVELSPDEKLASLEKSILASEKMAKADLVWFSEQKGITIPDDVKVPVAIRKHIKLTLESKDSEE